MHTTTCTRCGRLYSESSEEAANEPGRLCIPCYRLDSPAHGTVLLDDGEFYIELNVNMPAREAPGFLQRRRTRAHTLSPGDECVGSFDRTAEGWEASINAPYDEATDSDAKCLGAWTDRMHAIVALWLARRDAA